MIAKATTEIVCLSTGRILAPLEEAEIKKVTPHDEDLVRAGSLVLFEKPKPKASKTESKE